jgi:hypothetical protein
MTAAVLSYSLLDETHLNKKNGQIHPNNYNLPDYDFEKSKLYNCWINMADEPKKITLDKLLDTSDVESIDKMNALLNSKAINEIAENSIPKQFPPTFNFPNYFSPELSIFLTVTNLDGLPLEIKFGNATDTKNQFKMHSGFLHYSFSDKTNNNLVYPNEVITNKNYKNLIVAAKSTGAFPIGLENQKVKILKDFMQKYKENLFANHNINLLYDANNDYIFTAVDGGLINNEPIGTTAKFLNRNNKEGDIKPYMILIDPFPNITSATKKEPEPEKKESKYNLMQVIFKLFGAVRNHSMFKQEDLIDGLNMEKNKYLIYPSKKGYYFLACGLIEGFSGFFKRSFREHDYQLGRKNCQTFLRYYFGETVSDFKAMGINFTEVQQKIWGYYPDRDENNELKMPLIPDLLLNELQESIDYTEQSKDVEIETPHYDGLTKKELNDIVSKIDARVTKIVDKSYHLITDMKSGFWVSTAVCVFKSRIKNKIKGIIMSKTTNYLEDVFKPQLIKQEVLVKDYLKTIVENNTIYQKVKEVLAEEATGGEHVVTFTSSGYETKNTAKKGDYIVTNQTESQEKYIVSGATFKRDYTSTETSRNSFIKKSTIYALEFTKENFPELFNKIKKESPSNSPLFIETSWKESQAIRKNDYLVCDQNQTEIYRIDRKEFDETYALKENNP